MLRKSLFGMVILLVGIMLVFGFTSCDPDNGGGDGGGTALTGTAIIIIDDSIGTQAGKPESGESLLCKVTGSNCITLVGIWQYATTPDATEWTTLQAGGTSPDAVATLYLGGEIFDLVVGKYVRCVVTDFRSNIYPDYKSGELITTAVGPVIY